MKYITVKLTEDQFNHIYRALGNDMHDFSESYPEFPIEDDKDTERYNAFVQRLLDKLKAQYTKQI